MTALPWPNANDVSNGVYTDEYIEHFADRFIDAAIGIRGVTLMQYLANPSRYDNFDRSLDPLPLNARQQRIRRQVLDDELTARILRVERSVEDLPRRDGRIIESLHHRRYPLSEPGFVARSAKR